MNDLLIYGVSTLISIILAAGMIKNKIEQLTKDVEELEQRVYSFRDLYVTRQEFIETMHSLRQEQKEIRSDIRKILDLLSSK